MPIGKAAGSRTGGWSPEEKYEVLVGILKATGSFNKIPWGNFQPPEGRTLKACKHVIDGIKRELGLVNLHGQSKEGGIDESPGKGKKRKALSEAADDDDAGAEIADGGHKKRKTGSGKKGKGAKVKDEEVEDPSAFDELEEEADVKKELSEEGLGFANSFLEDEDEE